MKTVQIKVLRDNLSKYLKLVKERNTIIAELKQPSPETTQKTPWEIKREQWIKEGILTPAKTQGPIKLPKFKGAKMSSEEFWKMYDELREDRV